jgi:hypothetical protein
VSGDRILDVATAVEQFDDLQVEVLVHDAAVVVVVRLGEESRRPQDQAR